MSSESNNNVELSGALSSLNIESNESNNTMSIICATCGKEGDGDSMNSCNKCDLVKYCNAACKKKHRKTHKKKCEKRAVELYDEKLFREHPLREECSICMLPLSLDASESTFHPCCGKDICNGCIIAMVESGAKDICAFCRTPCTKSGEETIKRLEKLMDKDHAEAVLVLGGIAQHGRRGVPQNWAKANELYLKAGELGSADAYYNLGNTYRLGRGVEVDMKKAKHYYELAAINGHVIARYNLGRMEYYAGNVERAYKHFILVARAGYKKGLDAAKIGYEDGYVSKDEYANCLRAYQKRHDEMKSDTRDKARAINELIGG